MNPRLLLALAPAALLAQPAHARSSTPLHTCRRFTIAQSDRYARRIYRGTRHVTTRERRHLAYIAGCLKHPRWRRRVLTYDRHQARWHRQRVQRADALCINVATCAPGALTAATASWYNDPAGSGNCCGFNASQGVAVCGSGGGPCLPMGTRVLFVYGSRRAVCVADDHGPYVGGRSFDLDQGCAGALGFGGVGTVRYRVLQ